ncbi:hypothetical protein R5W24_000578 [Gemmata sp. JC717]|uniref:hypothetical protein n=1 Tax=Gemmata algarum TaxID=2975278 RepID=UPI0021BB67A7|nr:hypothetical protein [Gemmata algarum]MDY3551500.1 hypothetical protein [Gemmata algarum]
MGLKEEAPKMFHWLGSLFSSSELPDRFCPALESLGGRVVPAATAADVGRASGAAAPAAFFTDLDGATAPSTGAALIRLAESATGTPPSESETRVKFSGATQLVDDIARIAESLGTVNVGTPVAEREPFSGAKLALAGDLVVEIREALRAAPGEHTWAALQRLWLEGHLFGFDPEGLEQPFGPPSQSTQPAGTPRGTEAPHPTATTPPGPVTDAAPATAPRAHYDWWPIVVLDANEPSGPSPDLAPLPPPAPNTSEGAPRPAPSPSPAPAATGAGEPAAAADIIARFLPFDTADLRKGVNDFLYGLEPAIRAVPPELFDEWELGAVLVAGAGAALVAGKLSARTRRAAPRGRTFTDADHERATVLEE